MPSMFRNAIILGAGGVGRMLAGYLRPCCAALAMYDSVARDGARLGDANHPARALREELHAADILILSLPGDVLATALPGIIRCAAPGALIVETGSVKAQLHGARPLSTSVELLGINPMSAPSLGLTQQNVAVIRHVPGDRSAAFESCLAAWGARLVVLTAERHDRLMAVVQACAHAATVGFGAALCQSAVDVEELAAVGTPFFRAMLLLLNRILQQDPHVYWDIQANNPCADEARRQLAQAISDLSRCAADPDGFGAFAACLGSIRERLAPLGPVLDAGTAALFAQLAASPHSGSP